MPPYSRKMLDSKSGGRYIPYKRTTARRVPVRSAPLYTTVSRYARPLSTVELKHQDSTSGFTVPVTGAVVNLVSIANGTAGNERIGQGVSLHDMEFNAYMQMINNGLDVPWAVYIVHDRQTNGALPGYTDVFTSSDVIAIQNAAQRDRFKVLHEWHGWGSSSVGVGSDQLQNGQTARHLKLKKSLKGIKMSFNGVTAAISDIVSGSILLMCTASTAAWQISYRQRTQFFDN